MIFFQQDLYKQKKGIYGIQNTVNHKIYIGKTEQSFLKRFLHHRSCLQNGSHCNQHLQCAWNKYGSDSFVFFVLRTVENLSEINYLEQSFIQYYKRKNLAYNMSDGGDGKSGIPMSAHAKKIIGEKNRAHMLGRKLSRETKEKMSQTRKQITVHRKTDKLTEEQVKQAKYQLMQGKKPKQVAEDLSVSYSCINNILSNNTWDRVHINGWNEWCNQRQKTYRLKKEDAENIRTLYQNGKTIQELCDLYQKERHTISNIIHYRTFK